MTAIQAWQTGVPFSLGEGDQADLGNNFDNIRPSVIGCNLYANQTVQNSYNPACFVPSAYGTITPNPAVFNAGSIFTNYQATPNATAGQITGIVGNARQTQFSLKLLCGSRGLA